MSVAIAYTLYSILLDLTADCDGQRRWEAEGGGEEYFRNRPPQIASHQTLLLISRILLLAHTTDGHLSKAHTERTLYSVQRGTSKEMAERFDGAAAAVAAGRIGLG